MVSHVVGELFSGSDGQYYTDWQVRRNVRTGTWRLCLSQRDPNRTLIEVNDAWLILLRPIAPADLPDWAELRLECGRAWVVDTRTRAASRLREPEPSPYPRW